MRVLSKSINEEGVLTIMVEPDEMPYADNSYHRAVTTKELTYKLEKLYSDKFHLFTDEAIVSSLTGQRVKESHHSIPSSEFESKEACKAHYWKDGLFHQQVAVNIVRSIGDEFTYSVEQVGYTIEWMSHLFIKDVVRDHYREELNLPDLWIGGIDTIYAYWRQSDLYWIKTMDGVEICRDMPIPAYSPERNKWEVHFEFDKNVEILHESRDELIERAEVEVRRYNEELPTKELEGDQEK